MSLNIPSDDRVADAIFVVMYNNSIVKSQRALAVLVRKELNKGLDRYNISDERIRHIAISQRIVDVEIEYRDSDIAVGDVCPVCGSDIILVENSSLDGDTVVIKKKCTVCPFSKGIVRRSPGRYTFTRKRHPDGRQGKD